MKTFVLAAVALLSTHPLASQSVIPPWPTQELPEGHSWVYSIRAQRWVNITDGMPGPQIDLKVANFNPPFPQSFRGSNLKRGDILEFDVVLDFESGTAHPDPADFEVAFSLPSNVTLAQMVTVTSQEDSSLLTVPTDSHNMWYRLIKRYHVKLYMGASGQAQFDVWANRYKGNALVGYEWKPFGFEIK